MVILKMKPNTNQFTVNTKQSETKYARNHHISLPQIFENGGSTDTAISEIDHQRKVVNHQQGREICGEGRYRQKARKHENSKE